MELFRKNLRFFILPLMMVVAVNIYAANTYAAKSNVPTWMSGGGDLESDLGTKSEKVFNILLLVAAICGAIGFAVGLANINGVVGDAEKGPKKIKLGLLTMAVSGFGAAIVQFFSSL